MIGVIIDPIVVNTIKWEIKSEECLVKGSRTVPILKLFNTNIVKKLIFFLKI